MMLLITAFFLLFAVVSVVSDGFQNCFKFFYQNEPPQLFSGLTNEYKCICERYNKEYHFATLYDTSRKIPVFSAYTVEHFMRPEDDDGIRKWRKSEGLEKNKQPFFSDYDKVQEKKLNRGHLATRFYFSTIDGRKAADVLTNLAPQYEYFNKYTWFSLEKDIFEASRDHCKINYGGKSYFITGVLPSLKEPFKNKINIPSYFWTAVCCDTSIAQNDNRFSGWSFAYIVANVKNTKNIIEMFTVEDFVKHWRIQSLYGTRKLFKDRRVINNEEDRIVNNCLFDSEKADEIMQSIVTRNPYKNLYIIHRPTVKSPFIPFGNYLKSLFDRVKKIKKVKGLKKKKNM